MDKDYLIYMFKKGIWRWLSDRPRKLKSFFERGYYGWSEEDTWSFDSYLSLIIYEGLKHLRNQKHGYPITIGQCLLKDKEDFYEVNEKEWDNIMIKMIHAFKLLKEIGEGKREHYSPYMEEKYQREYNCLTKEENDIVEEGKQLFIKHFNSLWD